MSNPTPNPNPHKRPADGLAAASPTDVTPPPQKKLRKKSVTAKSLGLARTEFERIKALPLKRHLKTFIKHLNIELAAGATVEAQAFTTRQWATALVDPLQSVIDIALTQRKAFIQCHDVIRTIGDSWRDLKACIPDQPPRVMLEPVSLHFKFIDGHIFILESLGAWSPLRDVCGFIWRMLLRTAANNPHPDRQTWLMQAIKDANDNGVMLHSADVAAEASHSPWCNIELSGPSPTALDALVLKKDQWMCLDSTIRTFRARRTARPDDTCTTERRARSPAANPNESTTNNVSAAPTTVTAASSVAQQHMEPPLPKAEPAMLPSVTSANEIAEDTPAVAAVRDLETVPNVPGEQELTLPLSYPFPTDVVAQSRPVDANTVPLAPVTVNASTGEAVQLQDKAATPPVKEEVMIADSVRVDQPTPADDKESIAVDSKAADSNGAGPYANEDDVTIGEVDTTGDSGGVPEPDTFLDGAMCYDPDQAENIEAVVAHTQENCTLPAAPEQFWPENIDDENRLGNNNATPVAVTDSSGGRD